jgi:hypothetical protein
VQLYVELFQGTPLLMQLFLAYFGLALIGLDVSAWTAAALALFSFSALAQGLILLFVRSYYAMNNTKIPLIIGSISGGFIIFFSYFKLSLFYFIFFRSFRLQSVSHCIGSLKNGATPLCIIGWLEPY